MNKNLRTFNLKSEIEGYPYTESEHEYHDNNYPHLGSARVRNVERAFTYFKKKVGFNHIERLNCYVECGKKKYLFIGSKWMHIQYGGEFEYLGKYQYKGILGKNRKVIRLRPTDSCSVFDVTQKDFEAYYSRPYGFDDITPLEGIWLVYSMREDVSGDQSDTYDMC